uniref:Uncharacterized protein n=1 Tax=Arundo donax TaxID=35708 RepID=A0A0A9FTL1_ARUDO
MAFICLEDHIFTRRNCCIDRRDAIWCYSGGVEMFSVSPVYKSCTELATP